MSKYYKMKAPHNQIYQLIDALVENNMGFVAMCDDYNSTDDILVVTFRIGGQRKEFNKIKDSLIENKLKHGCDSNLYNILKRIKLFDFSYMCTHQSVCIFERGEHESNRPHDIIICNIHDIRTGSPWVQKLLDEDR